MGDIISSDGKNSKNIEHGISKGIGIICQIMHILDTISFGEHYIDVALLFRESMFLNGVMTNSEIWYNVTEAEIQEFDNIDLEAFFRCLFPPQRSLLS